MSSGDLKRISRSMRHRVRAPDRLDRFRRQGFDFFSHAYPENSYRKYPFFWTSAVSAQRPQEVPHETLGIGTHTVFEIGTLRFVPVLWMLRSVPRSGEASRHSGTRVCKAWILRSGRISSSVLSIRYMVVLGFDRKIPEECGYLAAVRLGPVQTFA